MYGGTRLVRTRCIIYVHWRETILDGNGRHSRTYYITIITSQVYITVELLELGIDMKLDIGDILCLSTSCYERAITLSVNVYTGKG